MQEFNRQIKILAKDNAKLVTSINHSELIKKLITKFLLSDIISTLLIDVHNLTSLSMEPYAISTHWLQWNIKCWKYKTTIFTLTLYVHRKLRHKEPNNNNNLGIHIKKVKFIFHDKHNEFANEREKTRHTLFDPFDFIASQEEQRSESESWSNVMMNCLSIDWDFYSINPLSQVYTKVAKIHLLNLSLNVWVWDLVVNWRIFDRNDLAQESVLI